MSKEISVDRRKFLGAAAGGAAAVAAGGPWVARAFSGTARAARSSRAHVGIQQFSIRDSITRLGRNIYDKDGNIVRANPTPTMGFLGGPNYPADPTDLGPTVPLPGGFLETFQFLKSIGYDGIEFFQFTQNIGSLEDPAAITPTNPTGGVSRRSRRSRSCSTRRGCGPSARIPAASTACTTRPRAGCRRTALTQVQNAKILGY